MNVLTGNISQLHNSGNTTLVDIDVDGNLMVSIVIGKPGQTSYLEKDKRVELLFNETEVSIGKNVQGQLSMSNQLPCTIISLEEDSIFSKVKLTTGIQTLESLITSRSARRLELKEGDQVTAFIKTNEVFLKEPE